MKLKLWEIAYSDYLQGLKYKDIAEKHGVALSTVKSWATRYWKNKDASRDPGATRQGRNAEKLQNPGKGHRMATITLKVMERQKGIRMPKGNTVLVVALR